MVAARREELHSGLLWFDAAEENERDRGGSDLTAFGKCFVDPFPEYDALFCVDIGMRKSDI
jgi:hypothetical protein